MAKIVPRFLKFDVPAGNKYSVRIRVLNEEEVALLSEDSHIYDHPYASIDVSLPMDATVMVDGSVVYTLEDGGQGEIEYSNGSKPVEGTSITITGYEGEPHSFSLVLDERAGIVEGQVNHIFVSTVDERGSESDVATVSFEATPITPPRPPVNLRVI